MCHFKFHPQASTTNNTLTNIFASDAASIAHWLTHISYMASLVLIRYHIQKWFGWVLSAPRLAPCTLAHIRLSNSGNSGSCLGTLGMIFQLRELVSGTILLPELPEHRRPLARLTAHYPPSMDLLVSYPRCEPTVGPTGIQSRLATRIAQF